MTDQELFREYTKEMLIKTEHFLKDIERLQIEASNLYEIPLMDSQDILQARRRINTEVMRVLKAWTEIIPHLSYTATVAFDIDNPTGMDNPVQETIANKKS